MKSDREILTEVYDKAISEGIDRAYERGRDVGYIEGRSAAYREIYGKESKGDDQYKKL